MLFLLPVATLLAPQILAEFILLQPEDYKAKFLEEGFPCPQACNVVNESTYSWAMENLPFFDASDKDIMDAYYFRIKSYRSHLIETEYIDAPFVVSEFGPAVSWGGAYGTINAAAGHHIHEGRWIRDPRFMDSEIAFWFGAHHFANGTRGPGGNEAYSSWIIMSALARATVLGNVSLLGDLLPAMVSWWEQRARYTRTDCAMDKDNFPRCLALSPSQSMWPQCYGILDGWDAMEGSVSGAGCRPTVNAMMYAEARAIATIAAMSGNVTLADVFNQRADWAREVYLDLLWNDEIEFFSVYKLNLQHNDRWACNCTDNPTCGNTSVASADRFATPHKEAVGFWSTLKSTSHNTPGCPPLWPCNKTANVRELLGLAPPYYFRVVPTNDSGPTKYDAMWHQLANPAGFAGHWGPTTVERRHRCFNQSQDMAECNWAGPSWPYETARVLSGMANFLIEYPTPQHTVTSTDFVTLLRTYARSHTQSMAVHGSQPWIGENIEPDKGYWIARSIMYAGGSDPRPVDCAQCRQDPRPRNCGGYTGVPLCCNGTVTSCNGTIIPTPDHDRGKDYNHSTFLDIVIAGLVGLRTFFGNFFLVHPLVDDSVTWFALDNVAYHGHNISISWDPKGQRHFSPPRAKPCPPGLCVYVDGALAAQSAHLTALNVSLGIPLQHAKMDRKSDASVPARVSNIDSIADGDLVFVQPPLDIHVGLDAAILAVGRATIAWLRSNGVAVHSNETVVHVALATRDATFGNLSLIEAIEPTVTKTPAAEFFARDGPSARYFRGKFRNESVGKFAGRAVTEATRMLGKPYATDFQPPPKDFYCSSLVEYSFQTVMHQQHVFIDQDFKLIFVPSEFWEKYYRAMNMSVPVNVSGSNPTLLLHSPVVSFEEISVF
eukprot:m.963503 g.963503  ORF g.963503 m.963503 type:complete len:887 (-) comp23896_c0_seq2:3267-5927(-)